MSIVSNGVAGRAPRRPIVLVASAAGLLAAGLLLAGAVTGCDRATGPKGGVRQRWYVEQVGWSDSRPAVAGARVYVGSGDGWLYARGLATGVAAWSRQVSGGRVDGANVLVRGGVAAAVATYEVVGVDATYGTLLWRFSAPPDPSGISPTLGGVVQGVRMDADDATLYVPAWGASVSAVDLTTGQARWAWQPGLAPTDTASDGLRYRSGAEGVRVSGDTVFAGVWHNVDAIGHRSEEWLVALDRATGRELWRAVLPAYTSGVTVDGAPALVGNLALVGTPGGDVWAVDRTTGQLAWHFTGVRQFATLSEPEAAPDGTDVVYRDGGDEHIYAIRASDGTVLWSVPCDASPRGDLLVTARRVYGSNGRQLLVFDRATGRRVAAVNQPHMPAEGGVISAPAAAGPNGQIFVTMSNGTLSFDEP